MLKNKKNKSMYDKGFTYCGKCGIWVKTNTRKDKTRCDQCGMLLRPRGRSLVKEKGKRY